MRRTNFENPTKKKKKREKRQKIDKVKTKQKNNYKKEKTKEI